MNELKLLIFLFIITFISYLIGFVMIFYYFFDFNLEDLYYEAIVNTWYDNYPILDA